MTSWRVAFFLVSGLVCRELITPAFADGVRQKFR